MSRTAMTPPSRLMLLVIGFIVWSVAFVALYAVNAIGCEFGWDARLQRAVLIGLFAIHVAVLGGLTFRIVRHLRTRRAEPERMLAYTGLGLTLAALVSTLFVFAPSLFVSLCV